MTAPACIRRPARLAWLGGALLAAACSGPALGDPSTALERVREHAASGELEEAAELGRVLGDAVEADPKDRAEGAFLAAEADFELGNDGRAFEGYRYVLENAPWSPHAALIEERLFALGQRLLFGPEHDGFFDDRARGVDVLETLASHYRSSPRADDALKLVADWFASPDVERWAEASLAYLRVVDEYGESEWAERCLWLAGHCRLRGASGPAYDRNELLRARDLLRRSLSIHPRGVALAEARADLASAEEQLAQAEVLVADFYAARGQATGEALRLANAALAWPQTAGGRLAAERLRALGLDPAELARDPRRHALDRLVATEPLWEQIGSRRPSADASPLRREAP